MSSIPVTVYILAIVLRGSDNYYCLERTSSLLSFAIKPQYRIVDNLSNQIGTC